MAVDALLQLQTAIYDALTGDVPLMAVIDDVYDFVPQNSTYPYVTIGDDDYQWWGAMGLQGGEYVVRVDVWSQAEGRAECKTILGLLSDALHDAALTITGNTHIATRLNFQDTIKEEDGFTHHGIQHYRVIVHE